MGRDETPTFRADELRAVYGLYVVLNFKGAPSSEKDKTGFNVLS
jgi:hypothetical protein